MNVSFVNKASKKKRGNYMSLLAKYATCLSSKKCCILFPSFPFFSLSRFLDSSYAPGSSHYCDG